MVKTTGLYPRVAGRHGTGPSGDSGRWGDADRDRRGDRAGDDPLGGVGPVAQALAVHDPAKVLLDLALTLALGGEHLCDIAVVASEPASTAWWPPIRRSRGPSTLWLPTRRPR